MIPLRIVVIVVAAFALNELCAAYGSTVEVFDVTFYGLDEQNDSTEPESVDVIAVPSDSQPNTDRPRPAGLPDSDVASESRRGGRRHHHHRGHGRHHHHRHHGNGMRRGWSGNWTDEQKMIHVCSRLQSRDTSTTPDEASSGPRTGDGRHRQGIQWKLRALNETSRETIINLWNRRKLEMLRCCNRVTMEAKMQCVNNTKAARYDRVCSRDEPLCIWSSLMPQTTPNNGTESETSVTTRCCALRGTERVNCFVDAKNAYLRQRMQERPPNPRWSHASSRGKMDRHRDHHDSI